MKKTALKFNSNWIACGLLLGAFVVSAIRFWMVSRDLGEGEARGEIIRVAHWQLEPGFREALQWAIDEYNALPRVKAAGVVVEQTAIAERFYNQFMNVHLISGTAPDIAVKKQSELISGNALASFYAPLGTYVEKPNPYNAMEWQIADLPVKLAKFLSEAPWRDTFFDGLEGGFEEYLSDYYAIPICTWGGLRMIYNLSILEDVKSFALEQASLQIQPEWLQTIWRSESNEDGYLPEDDAIEWLENDQIPQTLGQLILYCSAVNALAIYEGVDYLVPIAGSSYIANDVIRLYYDEFMSGIWHELSLEQGKKLSAIEVLAGFDEGVWNFETPMVREYFSFVSVMSAFYPQGFLGLDREQAQRRFVLGQAAILSTGGWDATSIYQGIQGRSDPNNRFEIAIAPEPMPVEAERWAEILTMRASEADAKGGVPFAINKQSPNFDWCVDFLMFISSHRINEGFAARAGWLPVISGAQPPESVRGFLPTTEGLPKTFSLNLVSGNIPSSIRNTWNAQTKLLATGDVEYEEMQEDIVDVLNDPRIGVRRAWISTMLDLQDKSRANQRSMSVDRLNAILGSDEAADRERSNTYLNLIEDEGVHVQRWWQEMYPEQTYPTY